jgi:uncharacterized protein
MLFDERPKDDIDDLFDRENEIEQFSKCLSDKRPLIIISGQRRAGKTSLLKTMLNGHIQYSIFIDLRNLAPRRYVTRKDVIGLVRNSLRDFLDRNKEATAKLRDLLKSVKGVNIGEIGVQLEHKTNIDFDMQNMFSKINEWARRNKEYVVLAIDEAQEFKKVQHLDMSGIIASIYDNCKNVIVVLAGSEVGLLYDFIGKGNPKAKLYGRSYEEIRINPLSIEKSKQFLVMGFKQYGMSLETNRHSNAVMDMAVQRLGGIIGWLIKFGIKCIQRKKITDDVLLEIEDEGAQLAKAEFESFLATREARKRYEITMQTLAQRPSTWSVIKRSIEIQTGKKMYNKNLSDLIASLEKSGFITKNEQEYMIVDPLLRRSFS